MQEPQVKSIRILNKDYHFYPISNLKSSFKNNIEHLPYTLKILLENLLRHLNTSFVTKDDILAFDSWLNKRTSDHEIAFHPSRVLMQDFTGVPAIVDLAAMRTFVHKQGKNPGVINPLIPVDLVIDHSVQVDRFGDHQSLNVNTVLEMQRNHERYLLLKWGQQAFENFRVVPPGTGICHQVNLEYLAKVAWTKRHANKLWLYPDTLVGTDSHTTMINGLGVLGWGVGGIEAEAAMLGQPISMVIPEVIGFKITGKLPEGVTATDLVLTITQTLRQHGVVGKFVEFYGPGLANLTLADRATISNMSPEFGATCGFFPIDDVTLQYLQLTGRTSKQLNLVKEYAKVQGLWHEPNKECYYSTTITLDLSTIEPSLAGPKRPQDKVTLRNIESTFETTYQKKLTDLKLRQKEHRELVDGDIVIAAITSCTNTSNPNVLIAAALLAKNALKKGLSVKPWVKTSLAPGSKVVTEYLHKTKLQTYLDQLGFHTVGYGCTTCIGNSGPLKPEISKEIKDKNLSVCSILSGNRNFEGRIHPEVKANWLASPPLVVAYALAGTLIDLTTQPLGVGKGNKPVYLRDIWPSEADIQKKVKSIKSSMFKSTYKQVFDGTDEWKEMSIPEGKSYAWSSDSTYIQYPPFFSLQNQSKENIINARILALLGDSITTDHISPAGSIHKDSPAGQYLMKNNVEPSQFNSFGSRRGNHEVMMRGTFGNLRIRNEISPDKEGGFTIFHPTKQITSIYQAAMDYLDQKIPVVVISGKDYGTGSSRDWAAKGARLLGIRAVIAESFERIHRSNLVGMGILPLQFMNGENRKTLNIKGDELITIEGIDLIKQPKEQLSMTIRYSNGQQKKVNLLTRIDTQNELQYFRHGGILNYVMHELLH